MNVSPKVQLSTKEMEMVTNTEWILTKRHIINKVCEMFGEINEMMRKELTNNDLLEKLKYYTGKISKGENYKMLPYVTLDYPAAFVKNNIFAVRTMFWWGNFFSITLHLSGDNKAGIVDNNPSLLSYFKRNNFFICVSTDEWQHDFNEENYVLASAVTDHRYKQILDNNFFKAAKKLSLNEWDNAYNFIMESFKEIIGLTVTNFQGDRKDLLPGFPTAGSGL
jgi:hypothetical protein